MNHEHSHVDRLNRRWHEEDAARDRSERGVRQSFRNKQAKTFAPIENYVKQVGKNASSEAHQSRSTPAGNTFLIKSFVE